MEIVSPKVETERMTEKTVPMGLKIDTKTGPLFFIAHPLKLKLMPLTIPPYIQSSITFHFIFICIKDFETVHKIILITSFSARTLLSFCIFANDTCDSCLTIKSNMQQCPPEADD